MFFTKKLSSGLRVIAQPLMHFKSVSIGVWIKTGSACETDAENGISHFIEHMFFKGTHDRSAKQIAAEMDKVGGQINAFTSKECTCLPCQGDEREARRGCGRTLGYREKFRVRSRRDREGKGRHRGGDQHVQRQPGGSGPRNDVRHVFYWQPAFQDHPGACGKHPPFYPGGLL